MKNFLKSVGRVLLLGSVLVIIFGGIYKGTEEMITTMDFFEANQKFHEKERATLQQTVQKLTQVEQRPQQFTVLVGGDVMLDRGVEASVKNNGEGDWKFPWEFIADDLKKADVVFLNHEGAISDKGADSGKKFSFNFDVKALEGLQYAGVDVVSMANNHMLDWGYDALCDSITRLNDGGIATVGAGCDVESADAAHVVTFADGSTVGFLGFTEFYKGAAANDTRGGLAEYTLANMKAQTQKLSEEVDVVMVATHWGVEYKTRSNEAQQELGKALVDAGADVIVGHHPHVAQEIERYNDGWIIYSLGNFIFDQYFSEETMRGLVGEVIIEEGKVKDIIPRTIQMNEFYQPRFVD